jgi:hypothetical protein
MPALTTYQAGDSEYGAWSGEWIEDSNKEQDIETAGSEKDDNSRDERWCVDWIQIRFYLGNSYPVFEQKRSMQSTVWSA